jgi:hypothetical protein
MCHLAHLLFEHSFMQVQVRPTCTAGKPNPYDSFPLLYGLAPGNDTNPLPNLTQVPISLLTGCFTVSGQQYAGYGGILADARSVCVHGVRCMGYVVAGGRHFSGALIVECWVFDGVTQLCVADEQWNSGRPATSDGYRLRRPTGNRTTLQNHYPSIYLHCVVLQSTCQETQTGVFTRTFSKAMVTLDCNTFTGTINMRA